MTKPKSRIEKLDDEILKAQKKATAAMLELRNAKRAKDERHCAVMLTMSRSLWESYITRLIDAGMESLAVEISEKLEGQ